VSAGNRHCGRRFLSPIKGGRGTIHKVYKPPITDRGTDNNVKRVELNSRVVRPRSTNFPLVGREGKIVRSRKVKIESALLSKRQGFNWLQTFGTHRLFYYEFSLCKYKGGKQMKGGDRRGSGILSC